MKRIVSCLLVFVIVLSLVSCGTSSKSETGKITLIEVNSPVELHNSAVSPYLKDEDLNGFQKYHTKDDQSLPNPVRFSWKWEGETKPENYVVKASETKDFKEYFIERTKHENVKMYNFKMNTKYYWCVTASVGGKEITSDIGEFITEDDAPRMLYCDNVPNMRDLGNWKTEDGKRVKQGMVYRCAKLNDNYTTQKLISDDGVDLMKRLCIKGELDLRAADEAGITKSVLDGVNYLNIPIKGKVAEKNYFVNNKEQLVKVFDFLGNKNNYPLIIHCSVGADRTGFISYTLSTLLGVSEKDALKDYTITSYAYSSAWTIDKIDTDYVDGYNSCQGATLAEKVENHLLSVGVKKENIDTFKSLMLE